MMYQVRPKYVFYMTIIWLGWYNWNYRQYIPYILVFVSIHIWVSIQQGSLTDSIEFNPDSAKREYKHSWARYGIVEKLTALQRPHSTK